MQKRLHDKKAGIAILISLIIISLADIIFRALALGLEAVLTTANFGEQVAVIALAVTILILTAKGKDRACYICYGAWIGYFVFDQIFELPGFITELAVSFKMAPSMIMLEEPSLFHIVGPIAQVLSMCCIIAIGVFLAEYMNDGTICNRAFNILCAVTVILIAYSIVQTGLAAIAQGGKDAWLATFNNLYRLTMVFMFTFFAYDSAKAQLKKTDLTK